MDDLDRIFEGLCEARPTSLPIIVCMFTGPSAPAFSAPMARLPNPSIGMGIDRSFMSVLEEAIDSNPAVHDGAIMLGRVAAEAPYEVVGWSYRLFPPEVGGTTANRGSAFNSCFAMSMQESVDRLYLASRSGLYRFIRGVVEMLEK